MKAPDKIYMPNELLSEEWQRHIEGEDTEYVRKEAVLALVDKLYDEALSYDDSRVYLGKAYELINSL